MSTSAKLRKSLAHFAILPRALGLFWDAAPGWTCAWGFLLVVRGLLPLASVCFARPLIDGLAHAVRNGYQWETVASVLLYASVIAAASVVGETLQPLTSYIRTHQTERVQDHVMALVHRKSVEIDLSFYDTPDFFDRLHRARIEATYRPVSLIDALASLLQNGVSLIGMFAVLVSFGVWLPVVLVAGTLPAFCVVIRYAVNQHELRARTSEDERRVWYHDWLLTSRETAAEVRIFGLGQHFQAWYQSLRAGLRNELTRLALGNAVAELAASMLSLAVSAASLGWVLWRTLHGLVTLGGLAMFYQAFQTGLRLARSLLDNVGQTYYNILFLGNLFEFLEIKPKLLDPAAPVRVPQEVGYGITFRDVTFRYPGSAKPTLRNFNLTIPAGRMTAFVGPNGAGKSTITKLVCRFYDPEAGSIELDGIDVREFSQSDLRSRISVLLQDTVRYNASVSDNITIAELNYETNSGRVRKALTEAGAADIVAALPNGCDQLLGKMFLDGVELSTGEWQRIALARAFYRSAPILILDEPTSAMDPWAEADWLDRFRNFSANRTSILITHRLTTAMRADIIHVISDGEIIESGSHAALLNTNGLYAQSWRTQTEARAVRQA